MTSDNNFVDGRLTNVGSKTEPDHNFGGVCHFISPGPLSDQICIKSSNSITPFLFVGPNADVCEIYSKRHPMQNCTSLVLMEIRKRCHAFF